jgi:hypothetical protein
MTTVVEEAPVAAPAAWRAMARRSRAVVRTLFRDPQLRLLRWVLFVGALVRFILAPLTSWAIDTPGFVLGDLQLIYTGNPYASDLFFNPPLTPVLESPTVLLALWLSGSQPLVVFYGSIAPAATATGMASPLVPTPLALLASKTPLILADLAAALVIWRMARPALGVAVANRYAALWLLNPLLIWATAIHGEADGLAALFVLLTLWMLIEHRPFPAGVFAALAIFAKGYPIVLLPLFLGVILTDPVLSAGRPERRRVALRWGAGLALGSLPFVGWIVPLLTVLTQNGNATVFGGLSVMVVFNAAVPQPFEWAHLLLAGQLAPVLLNVFRAMALVSIVGAPLAVRWYRRTGRWPEERAAVPLLAALAAWCVVGTLIAVPSPQSENMVGALALLLVATPALTATARWAYPILSSAALGLYFALLTPAAYFYPLALAIGPGAVAWVNAVGIEYAAQTGLASRGTFWLITGVAGGVCLLAVWGSILRHLVPLKALRLPGGEP